MTLYGLTESDRQIVQQLISAFKHTGVNLGTRRRRFFGTQGIAAFICPAKYVEAPELSTTPAPSTTSGQDYCWQECDAGGVLVENGRIFTSVEILGDVCGSYPLVSTTPESGDVDRRSMGMIFNLKGTRIVVLEDFLQHCLVKCTDAVSAEFSEMDMTGDLIPGGRVFSGCQLLGDTNEDWELSDTEGAENIGVHILIPNAEVSGTTAAPTTTGAATTTEGAMLSCSWVHGIIQIVAPTYAYYYPEQD